MDVVVKLGLALWIFTLGICNQVFADAIETLVMPGQVIEGHAKYESECSNCHKVFSKHGQDDLCLDCHKKIRADVQAGKGFHGRKAFSKDANCKSCHTEHKGRDADIIKLDTLTFNHNDTDFRLRFSHQTAQCTECHAKDKKHREAPHECLTCHKKVNPHKHPKAKQDLFLNCHTCHRESKWNDMIFDHNKTNYKLTGAHKEALCVSCHAKDQYTDTPDRCVSCHKQNDVHRGKNGDNCQKCHNTSRWKKISFDHDKDTKFPLKGGHKKVECLACHPRNTDKKKTAKECYACHVYDDRHNGVFGRKCEECHVESDWKRSKFDHDKDTKFDLRGTHKTISCQACHRHKDEKLKLDCVSCHKKDDVHKGQLGKHCNSCHTEKSWKEKVQFDHDLTKFPLVGGHRTVTCEECHVTTNYKDLSTECFACHKNSDEHKGKLGEDCASCHTPNDWRIWLFDHDKQTKFKLTGKHKEVHCHDCHTEAMKKLQSNPRSCINCHAADDAHRGQFGSNCDKCHTTTDFKKINM